MPCMHLLVVRNCAAEENTLLWKRAPLVRIPMRMAPLFRIMGERSSGVEKVALIWIMEALSRTSDGVDDDTFVKRLEEGAPVAEEGVSGTEESASGTEKGACGTERRVPSCVVGHPGVGLLVLSSAMMWRRAPWCGEERPEVGDSALVWRRAP